MKMGHIAGKLTMLTRLDELLVGYDVTLCLDERKSS
jgi:hypothetical protein